MTVVCGRNGQYDISVMTVVCGRNGQYDISIMTVVCGRNGQTSCCSGTPKTTRT